MKQVAPLFEKPQDRLKAAEGGEVGPAEGGSAAAAAAADSGAAGSESSDPQPIIIDDGNSAGPAGEGSTEDDDDTTESEGEKMQNSLTDTDSQADVPLSSDLTAKLSAFVAQEKAVTGKKRSKVWS
eukprot:3624616-Rhodomonas_salina.1